MKYFTKAGGNFTIDYDENFKYYTARTENKTPYYRNFNTQLCLSIPELLSFFDEFGIDIIKPDELVWTDEGEKLRYTARYRCAGSFKGDSFSHRISRMNISAEKLDDAHFSFLVSDIVLPKIVLELRTEQMPTASQKPDLLSGILKLFKK